MKKKFSSWKINFLTPAGRLVLAHAIPTHSMRYLYLPKRIYNSIDKTQRDLSRDPPCIKGKSTT